MNQRENKMKTLESILLKYDQEVSKLLYYKAVDLMNLISDIELYKLYQDFPEQFAEVSKMKSIEDVMEIKDTVYEVIEILTNYLNNRGLTEEEFEEMDKQEFIDYIGNVLWEKDLSYEDVKFLENYDPRNQED